MLSNIKQETQERIFFWYSVYADFGWNGHWKLPDEVSEILMPYYNKHFPDGINFYFSPMDSEEKDLKPFHPYISVDNKIVVNGETVGYVELDGEFNKRRIERIVFTIIPTYKLCKKLGLTDLLREVNDKAERVTDEEITGSLSTSEEPKDE